MKKTRKERGWLKKTFKRAMDKELREHKSSFIVFYILRALVIVSLVRQIILDNYEGAFFCILTIVLLYVPSWVQVRLRIELPPPLEITILCFIFAAEILGEVNAFYVNVPHWDTMLHTINGFLAAAVGFSLVLLLNDNEKLTFDLSPFFLAMVAFCFSMTIGVLWEFFEFGMDWFFHTDMQRDTVINAIYSASLDPTRTNKVVAVKEIHDVVINGENLVAGTGLNEQQPRTAIGQAKDGTVIMMVVDGRQMHSFGISIERCGEIMEQYGAYQASMLDGGSSSVMVYRGREITSPTTLSQNEEGRYLPDAFLVK